MLRRILRNCVGFKLNFLARWRVVKIVTSAGTFCSGLLWTGTFWTGLLFVTVAFFMTRSSCQLACYDRRLVRPNSRLKRRCMSVLHDSSLHATYKFVKGQCRLQIPKLYI